MKPERVLSGIDRLLRMQEEHEGTAALMDALRPRFAALANRHENGTAPRAVSAFNLFQTPAPLAARMAELAGLAPGLRLLEPSAGLGRILTACETAAPGLQTVAVEIAPQCAAELFASHPEARLLQRDFLAVSPDEIGTFDRVVMNPPFKMRRDIRHIRHALDFVKPGGCLVALCLAADHRREAFEAIADHFEEIPAGAFRAEGTSVATYLIRITKPL